MSRPIHSTAVLKELEPVVAENLDRHLATAQEWFPHQHVPWSQGRDFDGFLDGEAWDPSQSTLPEVARTSLVVNLLTEDNLPSYHHENLTRLGRDSAWGTWAHRWTAEEARHGAALRDYLLTTRAVDPVALERARMVHMSAGYHSEDQGVLEHLAYVSFQELATRISHRNTGRITGEPVCDRLLTMIARDENLHMIFYRNLLVAAMELAPDDTMCVVRDVVVGFQMPGSTIPGFRRKAAEIAKAGVYDLRIHHDEVLAPILRELKVFDRGDLSAAGERARDELSEFLAALDRSATRFVERRGEAASRGAAGNSPATATAAAPR